MATPFLLHSLSGPSVALLDLGSLRDVRELRECSGAWQEGGFSRGLISLVHPQLANLPAFQIYKWMDNFVTEHSDIVSKIRIGRSVENRSIFVLKVNLTRLVSGSESLFKIKFFI